MPWAIPMFPGLGPALLRSILQRDGMPCDILYGNLMFSRAIGGDVFFEQYLGQFAFSELAFTPSYFDTPPQDAARLLWEYTGESAQDSSAHHLERFEWLVERADWTIREIYSSVRWDDYDVVGFAVMMQQTVSSLALARMIKRGHPDIQIVFGGANCSAPMGPEMVRAFPEIDYVVVGEGDDVIGPLVEQIRAGGEVSVPGVYLRNPDGTVRNTGPNRPFTRVDELPVPDYGPFFEQLGSQGVDHVHPYLQMEMSRGCWWGEKHHCSFCSLEDALMTFRAKSEDRLIREIMELAEKHRCTEFFPTDSIINHRYYTTLLPRIAQLRDEMDYDFTFFFEIKSNIRREHARALRSAGVNVVQPGIESFSNDVLALMDKGSNGTRQIQCLKLLAEQGIVANWNIIYRNPNERESDCEALVNVIPYLHHLPPLHERGLIPMLLMRFSPCFERPEAYGITNIRPADFYRHIFPTPDLDVASIAYYFDYDHADHENERLPVLHQDLRSAIEEWRRVYRKDSLLQRRGPGFITVTDRRVPPGGDPSATYPATVLTLEGVFADIFASCDEVRSQSAVERAFAERLPVAETRLFLDDLAERRLIYRGVDGSLITLPLLVEVREQAAVPAPTGVLTP